MIDSFSKRRFCVVCLFLLLLLETSVWATPTAAFPVSGFFPENVFVRNRLIDRILGPIDTAAALEPELFMEPGFTHRVQFFIEKKGDDIYFCFYHGGETTFARPVRGSLYLKRNRESGDLLRMRIFYKNDPESYLSIEPAGKGMSRFNIFLLGRNIQQDILLPEDLEKIARMPVAEILRLTAAYVDWSFYLPEGELPFPVLSSNDELVEQIRPYLRQLKDAEDGAIDESGRFVFIKDGSLQGDGSSGGLNCSGFAKWVVDGILYPETGGFLSLDILKQKHVDIRGNRWSSKEEGSEDPYFGLDWTRNLALQALKIFHPRRLETDEAYGTAETPVSVGSAGWKETKNEVYEAADVNYLRYHEYKEDVGYPVEELPTILYELARKNYDSFYLGSLNDLAHGDFDLRKHYHVALFFPWLDGEGSLRNAVMERNHETELARFIERYRGSYVHLVEVPNRGAFTPGTMKLEPAIKR
jgi:hypothetical protein